MKRLQTNAITLIIIFLAMLLFFPSSIAETNQISPAANVTVYYFYGQGCPHCARVMASGVLEKIAEAGVPVQKYEIYYNAENAKLFNSFADAVGLDRYERGVPFAVISCNGNLSYLIGDKPIIDNIEKAVSECQNIAVSNGGISPTSQTSQKITIGAIVTGALVDSINPCAIAVLVFLLLALISAGSRKRALKIALIYIAAVYITYFLAGLGIFRAIQKLTQITHAIYVGAGILVILAGLIEIKDFFWYGKGISLKIPASARPRIEKLASRGTIPAVVLLGFFVSMFELPCTGGIYLAILTMLSISKINALPYLLLYNFIFVLPLIVITFAVYKGTNPQLVEKWRLKERKWMRLAAGLVMIALGIYILVF